MQNNPFQDTDRPYQDTYPPYRKCSGPFPGRRHGSGIVRTALMWTAIAILVMCVFGVATWALGLIFGLFALLLKIALVTAVVAFVWRRVARRNHRSYDL